MRVFMLLCSFFFSGFVAAAPLKNIVIFGDSLSDNGNLYEYFQHKIPPSPPYFEGRFSNGPAWIERLTKSYFPNDPEAHLLDYAFGGAGVSDDSEEDALFTLSHEIDTYLLAHEEKADPDSLFIIWIGANNYAALAEDDDKAVRDVVGGISKAMQRLASLGAKHVMVMNLPDLGKTPAAKDLEAEDRLTYLINENNKALLDALTPMRAAFPDVQWMYFDVGSIVNDVMTSPGRYGFTNITDTCYEIEIDKNTKNSVLKMASSLKAKNTQDGCDGYLFFDPVHSTAPAHQLMADKAREYLDEQGVKF